MDVKGRKNNHEVRNNDNIHYNRRVIDRLDIPSRGSTAMSKSSRASLAVSIPSTPMFKDRSGYNSDSSDSERTFSPSNSKRHHPSSLEAVKYRDRIESRKANRKPIHLKGSNEQVMLFKDKEPAQKTVSSFNRGWINASRPPSASSIQSYSTQASLLTGRSVCSVISHTSHAKFDEPSERTVYQPPKTSHAGVRPSDKKQSRPSSSKSYKPVSPRLVVSSYEKRATQAYSPRASINGSLNTSGIAAFQEIAPCFSHSTACRTPRKRKQGPQFSLPTGLKKQLDEIRTTPLFISDCQDKALKAISPRVMDNIIDHLFEKEDRLIEQAKHYKNFKDGEDRIAMKSSCGSRPDSRASSTSSRCGVSPLRSILNRDASLAKISVKKEQLHLENDNPFFIGNSLK